MKFNNTYTKLPERFYAATRAAQFSAPYLLAFNQALAKDLGLNLASKSEDELALIFSGQTELEGSQPIALAYAGHQFGHFVPQLGDGRALLMGEVLDPAGKRFDVQLKGSGQTVFSRNGDGRSAMGPVIREYIVSEAMHRLGVPTTRALAAVGTGDSVQREVQLPGAVFVRIAASHIRIGTFQYFASRNDSDGLKALLDYSIDRHYPFIRNVADANPAVLFLRNVMLAQVSLVSQWMSFGFIHGVMNTDNVAVSGETLDFGPCAFMDTFSFGKVFSSIDQHGRYAYINQGPIAHWNLSRLAECLMPLTDPDGQKAIDLLNAELERFPDLFDDKMNLIMKKKLGLVPDSDSDINDKHLVTLWLKYLEDEKLDFTLSFRQLADSLEGGATGLKLTEGFQAFKTAWLARLEKQATDMSEIKRSMNAINPLYIARNHQVERAIQAAIHGDLSVFNELNRVLQDPFHHQRGFDLYQALPEAEEEVFQTFCGT